MTTYPTKRIHGRITCVLVDDDGFEITVEDTASTDRYHNRSWRFTVADASHYPVGADIGITVPA